MRRRARAGGVASRPPGRRARAGESSRWRVCALVVRLRRLALHGRRRRARAKPLRSRANFDRPAPRAARRARPGARGHAGSRAPCRRRAPARGRRSRRARGQPRGSARAAHRADDLAARLAAAYTVRIVNRPGRTLRRMARARGQSPRTQLLPGGRGGGPRRPAGRSADHQRGGWPRHARLALGPARARSRVRARPPRQARRRDHRPAGDRREGRRQHATRWTVQTTGGAILSW